MQIHTSSAHTLGQCESFKHLSPQAKEALLSLKIKNFGFEQPDDLANVKAITTNNHDNPSALTESIVDQVVRHPSQNEFMGSQNFSFIYNSKSLLAFKNSVVLDDPTPDFSDALSSEREHINETLQNQQLIQKQLKLFSNLQVKQPKDRIQENKGFIKIHSRKRKHAQSKYQKELLTKQIKRFNIEGNQKYFNTNFKQCSQNILHKLKHIAFIIDKIQFTDSIGLSLQKAICLQEKQKTFIDQGQLINTTKEMKEQIQGCPFQQFFERQSTWMRKKNDKITQQVEIQKEKATKECTFSPNLRDTSNNRIDSCDVYYRNLQWEKKFNKNNILEIQ